MTAKQIAKKLVKPSIFILVLMISIGPFGDTEYTPSLPHIADSFGVSYDQAQFTMTSYLIGYSLSQIFYGPLSDRFGRKPLMVFGASMFVVGSLVCYLSVDIWMLISGRFVQAIGACAGSVISNAAVRDAFPKKQQGRVFATINAAFAIAPGIGPIVGSYVDTYFGWHANFLVLLILAAFLLLMVILIFPETNLKPNLQAARPSYMAKNYCNLFKDPYYLPNVILMGLCIGIVYACLTAAPALVQLIYNFTQNLRPSYSLKPDTMIKIIAIGVMFGFMLGSILARCLTRYLNSNHMILVGLAIVLINSFIMATLAFNQHISLTSMLTPIIIIFVGLAFVVPMATANALAPFTMIVGSASAMLGFFQMGIAALATAIISLMHLGAAISMALLFIIMSVTALLVLFTFILRNPYKPRLEVTADTSS